MHICIRVDYTCDLAFETLFPFSAADLMDEVCNNSEHFSFGLLQSNLIFINFDYICEF